MFNPPNKTQANSLFQEGVQEVNRLSESFEVMSDEQLAGMTAWLRRRHERGETLDKLLPEAFATVREASSRVLGMRHFDEQIMGGVALHKGMVAEMRDGEGRTLLVAPLAAYLSAIAGKGVHVVTVSDYLAKRDSERLGRLYERLGMRVGCLQSGMDLAKRREAYKADVTYGSYSEFSFDYLRDHMVNLAKGRVQRGHAAAIVDDADFILIDEARTPLTISGVISGVSISSASTYKDFAWAVRGLTHGVDFEMDEAKYTIVETDEGLRKIERRLGIDDLYSDPSGQMANHLRQALRAQYLFHRDQQYIVVGGEVKIVDEFTGRAMEGRRYGEGLHQAIEAKEGVCVREENQTLATIALQNYFRLYGKLSGMAGAATGTEDELKEIYKLPVQAIPTHEPMIRKDYPDLVYQGVDAKFAAVADDIVERHAKGQPVLVGTVSIESSERLSRTLGRRGIPHEVLNAKHHEREAQIVAQAGREGAVTIATNMAGRGTDIILGGNPDELARDMLRERGYFRPAKEGEEPREPSEAEWGEARRAAREVCEAEREHVLRAGGLCVIGTERHESRRIDDQLRGRSGRRGDPGETQFYLSFEDDLILRNFSKASIGMVANLLYDDERPLQLVSPFSNSLFIKSVKLVQRKVEEINFANRKLGLDYDEVLEGQRKDIYKKRDRILDGGEVVIGEAISDVVRRRVSGFCPGEAGPGGWDLKGLRGWVEGLTGSEGLPGFEGERDRRSVEAHVKAFVDLCYSEKSRQLSDGVMRTLSTWAMLRAIDACWASHLQKMSYLRAGIGLRHFGGTPPLAAYQDEARAAFAELESDIREDFLRTILRFNPAPAEEAQAPESGDDSDRMFEAGRSGPVEADGNSESGVVSARRAARWTDTAKAQAPDPAPSKPVAYRKADSSDPYMSVVRNDPCPCGSGKKFKNCHGRNRGGGTR